MKKILQKIKNFFAKKAPSAEKNSSSMALYENMTLEKYKHDLSWSIKSHESTIGFALATIKSLLLLNSGAIAVFLTFVKNNASCAFFTAPILIYLFGIISAVFLCFFSYLSQDRFTHTKNCSGIFFQIFAVIFAAISLIFFFYGTLVALKIFNAEWLTIALDSVKIFAKTHHL